jgi:CobQ-like glutamine amidotransferase family enzyme
MSVETHLSGSYMVYNLLAVAVAAQLLGADAQSIQRAIAAFDPKNGRLQKYEIAGHSTLLNLAKNPTGFNQNLRIIMQDAPAAGQGQFAAAFFINDKDVDGHDISWIWDIDFEELAAATHARVFAGGSRKNDLQVRLKYAGIKAQLVDSMADVFAAIDAPGAPAVPVYSICNYTALAPVHAELDATQARCGAEAGAPQAEAGAGREAAWAAEVPPVTPSEPHVSKNTGATLAKPLVIAHLFPDLLNLYGDGGNVTILQKRLEWRGIPVEVRSVNYGQSVDLDTVDLVFLGGGPDRQQRLAADELERMSAQLAQYVRQGGPVLAICGGYQILGRTWLMGDEEVPGLGILGVETRRPGPSTNRIIGNIALDSTLATHPVVGYENHAGRTYLDPSVTAFGQVTGACGKGNNDTDAADGALCGNVLGTYLHGCLLSKNPQVADWLLARALERHAQREAAAQGSQGAEGSAGSVGVNSRLSAVPEAKPSGVAENEAGIRYAEGVTSAPATLAPLDDAEELAANAYMAKKLGAHQVKQ